MQNKEPHNIIPNYVIHALIAGVLFLLAATILGLLLFLESPAEMPDEAEPPPDASSAPAAQLETPQDERPILMLDAGHGGHDPGAVSGYADETEAEICQIIVERLLKLLEPHATELRVEVSRPADTYATTRQRARAARAMGADFFLSLHLNANEEPQAQGFQVYPVPPGRPQHADSLRFAEILVEQVKKTGVAIQGSNGIFYNYYHEMENGNTWQQQQDSAEADPSETSDSPTFGVLENCGCPGVLVEQWFISSMADLRKFNNNSGYNAMAQCLYRSICSYFGLKEN